jgi:vacuolar-type H+-ATPase subunit H
MSCSANPPVAGTRAPAGATAGPVGAPTAADPWSPVRNAALAGAHAEAGRLLAGARERSAAAVAAAHERAGTLRKDMLATAREAAEEDARRTLSAARASAHDLLLATRREVYAAVARDVARQASSHREEYEAASERLIADARQRLGTDVEITEAPDGGIIARAPGRQIDYSLSTRVRHCLAQLDDEVATLWS